MASGVRTFGVSTLWLLRAGTDDSIPGSCVEANSCGVPSGDREEYVMWGFSARREKFGPCLNRDSFDADALKTIVLALMKDWDPSLRWIVQNNVERTQDRAKQE